jgi:hypothetical protein
MGKCSRDETANDQLWNAVHSLRRRTGVERRVAAAVRGIPSDVFVSGDTGVSFLKRYLEASERSRAAGFWPEPASVSFLTHLCGACEWNGMSSYMYYEIIQYTAFSR